MIVTDTFPLYQPLSYVPCVPDRLIVGAFGACLSIFTMFPVAFPDTFPALSSVFAVMVVEPWFANVNVTGDCALVPLKFVWAPAVEYVIPATPEPPLLSVPALIVTFTSPLYQPFCTVPSNFIVGTPGACASIFTVLFEVASPDSFPALSTVFACIVVVPFAVISNVSVLAFAVVTLLSVVAPDVVYTIPFTPDVSFTPSGVTSPPAVIVTVTGPALYQLLSVPVLCVPFVSFIVGTAGA